VDGSVRATGLDIEARILLTGRLLLGSRVPALLRPAVSVQQNPAASLIVPNCRCGIARPDLGERWPSRLVATAAKDRLKIATRTQFFAAAIDCRTIAIYEYTP
jgi:hypothetical protein